MFYNETNDLIFALIHIPVNRKPKIIWSRHALNNFSCVYLYAFRSGFIKWNYILLSSTRLFGTACLLLCLENNFMVQLIITYFCSQFSGGSAQARRDCTGRGFWQRHHLFQWHCGLYINVCWEYTFAGLCMNRAWMHAEIQTKWEIYRILSHYFLQHSEDIDKMICNVIKNNLKRTFFTIMVPDLWT